MDDSVSADELLTIARRNRSIVSLYRTEQDEDREETGEDVTRDDSWNYAEILWNGIQAKAVTAAFEQLSYKEQWYLEKRNAICLTCGRVSPLSTQSTFEDLAVDFEGTTASGAERFYRRTLDKLRLKLLESGVIHTVTLKQTERRKKNKKIAAAVYLYQADNDGEWGELRFDFENGTAEIVRLADWDTVKSNIFAKTAIRFVQGLPEARLLKSVVVPFEMGISEKPALPTSTAKATKINPAHKISLRQTECRKTGETITAAVYQYLVDNDGEWGELRFDFENGTAEIVKLADWDTVKSNIFAKTAIRYIQGSPEARLLKSVVVPFWKGRAQLSAEHDLCAEQAVLIGNRTHPAGFFCNVTDGLKSDAVSFSLGGLEYATFFADDSVIGVFNLNQCQTVAMQIGCQFDPASGRRGAQAGFQRIFQQIRENQTQIDFVYRKTFRQINLHGIRDILPFGKRAVIPDHAVCRPVFAEMHFKTWNSGNRAGKIGFDLFKIPFFCKGSELT